jgi:hypothetical protein
MSWSITTTMIMRAALPVSGHEPALGQQAVNDHDSPARFENPLPGPGRRKLWPPC